MNSIVELVKLERSIQLILSLLLIGCFITLFLMTVVILKHIFGSWVAQW